jgi:hypothetical protein
VAKAQKQWLHHLPLASVRAECVVFLLFRAVRRQHSKAKAVRFEMNAKEELVRIRRINKEAAVTE